MIKRWIRTFAYWLLRKVGTDLVPIPEDVRDALPLAGGLVHYYEQKYDGNQSGEFKRNTAYGQMRKKYPQMAHHDVGLAIELAIQLQRSKDATH